MDRTNPDDYLLDHLVSKLGMECALRVRLLCAYDPDTNRGNEATIFNAPKEHDVDR